MAIYSKTAVINVDYIHGDDGHNVANESLTKL